MDLHQIVQKLDEYGVGFKVIENPEIDTTSSYGKMIFSILGTVSEFERDLINERCRLGREFSKQRGVKFGRKPVLTDEEKDQIRYLSEQKKVGWNELANRFDVSRQTIYRALRG
jgi:DNA invertase Pin-like site-specific DNA recombinase